MKKRASGKDFQGVSEAEQGVLEALWSRGPSTPQALQESLADQGAPRAYTTIQTLLHRLLRKGFVERRAEGASQVYSVALSREEFLARHVADLAQRLCAGALSPLVLSLVQTKRLSRGDLARLREIVERSSSDSPAKRRGREK